MKGEPNTCTVYEDGTGDVAESGRFVLPDHRGATSKQLEYSAADGDDILLEGNLVLAPLPSERPASVPRAALLAENGAMSTAIQTGRMGISARSILPLTGGHWRAAPLLAQLIWLPREGQLQPHRAGRDRIELDNGGSSEAAEPRPMITSAS